MTLTTVIHGSQRMRPAIFTDPLNFPPEPSFGSQLCCFFSDLNYWNYWMVQIYDIVAYRGRKKSSSYLRMTELLLLKFPLEKRGGKELKNIKLKIKTKIKLISN